MSLKRHTSLTLSTHTGEMYSWQQTPKILQVWLSLMCHYFKFHKTLGACWGPSPLNIEGYCFRNLFHPSIHGETPIWYRSGLMMPSSNGNIFRVTGHLRGEFTSHRWIPRTKASDAELWYFFDLHLNERLSKQSWGWWFETPSCPLWRHIMGTPQSLSGAGTAVYHQNKTRWWFVSGVNFGGKKVTTVWDW